MQLTLLQRRGIVSPGEFNKALEVTVSGLIGKLSASAKLSGLSKRGWARLNIEGPDSEIVTEMVARELGKTEADLTHIEMHGVYEGLISGATRTHLEVDLGVETPRHVNPLIEIGALRAQLADGKPVSLNAILDAYCLFPERKLTIRVTSIDPDKGVIGAWLADSEIERFSDWMTTRLDRIVVFGCIRHELELKLTRSHLDRDIISLEPMTLTTNSLLCKLGTDAIGLIPRLGSVIRRAELKPFLPKRILAECRQW